MNFKCFTNQHYIYIIFVPQEVKAAKYQFLAKLVKSVSHDY